MQISQTYFTDDNSNPPDSIMACVSTINQFFPSADHVIYRLPEAREFLKTNFDDEVLNAFDELRPYTYKSDFFRYCVLYAAGGWYFDLPIRCYFHIAVPDNVETVAFRDTLPYSGTSWSCNGALLYSKPNSTVFERAIREVVKNVNVRFYGKNALSPTGPLVLGKVFASFGEDEKYVFGDYMFLTPLHHYKNPAFVLPNGQVFALGKEQFQDLTHFNAKPINSYVKMWNEKCVYGE